MKEGNSLIVPVSVLRRGPSERSCASGPAADGAGFALVVTVDGARHVERFSSLEAMLARERSLLAQWRAHGWEDVGR